MICKGFEMSQVVSSPQKLAENLIVSQSGYTHNLGSRLQRCSFTFEWISIAVFQASEENLLVVSGAYRFNYTVLFFP